MIDRLNINISLPPGSDKAGAVEECEGIFKQYMYPTIDKVFYDYGQTEIQANRLEVDLGKVMVGEIPYRLESELRQMLATLAVSRGEEALLLRRQTFQQIIDGTISPMALEGNAITSDTMTLDDAGMSVANGVETAQGHAISFNRSAITEVDASHTTCSIPDDAMELHVDTMIDATDIAENEELLSMAIESAIKDKRVFYRIVDMMDVKHLSAFVSRLAEHIDLSGDVERVSILFNQAFLSNTETLATESQHTVSSRLEASSNITDSKESPQSPIQPHSIEPGLPRHKGLRAPLSKHDWHNVLSSSAEDILFNQAFLPDTEKFTAEWLHTVSSQFEKRRQAFLEHAADMQDDPEKIGRLFVDDAGVMLLSPFFSSLFTNLGYLDGSGQFKSLNHRIKAVHVTRCLSCGFAGRHSESDLLLSKIICGLSPLFPIVGQYRILKKEKEEVDAMLSVVIGYWNSLKGTSTEGLRTAFLLRNGTLEKDGSGWTVRVEGKSIDILMDDIPWGFSTFVPPWTKTGIFVEWQKENEQ